MIWIIGISMFACGIGAFVAGVLHRREKATRPAHYHDRSIWSGT